MSNEIIKRMGGKIEVENTSSGAKFIIKLKK
jgi:C4-dicarboxylate-specific signal transduction histidine kinase